MAASESFDRTKTTKERSRFVKFAIKSRDTLDSLKVKRFARIGSVRLLGGLKLK